VCHVTLELTYVLMYVTCMRKFCDSEKNLARYFDGFTHFQPSATRKSDFWNAMSIFLTVYVRTYCHVIVTRDEVRIGNWIYWTLKTRNYK
jgi:hypothetical protein